MLKDVKKFPLWNWNKVRQMTGKTKILLIWKFGGDLNLCFLHNCLVPRFATCVELFICVMMKCNH